MSGSTVSVTIKFTWLDPAAAAELQVPSYETAGSSGMDVRAAVADHLVIDPGARALVPTGFAVAIPVGYEIQVRPRSGLAVKHGLSLPNTPGTIDADYRGEVKIAMINLGAEPITIRRGERIAQMVVAPVVRAAIEVVSELDDTTRGSGGFGHTGV
ncbi:MAG: dUTP diphosphatase [Desulfofustis sp.]|nr:dUTP diphosphatase [Desulfofustis sp.]NNK13601.1 dUTP diphosphatase [Desulfofustis sp.]NNK56372.1 dUTP diphosphatase [Desulfofustis sp.]